MFVRIGRESVSLDPTATTAAGPAFSLHADRETEINSILEMFRSRAILEKAVDKIGAQRILEGKGGIPVIGFLARQAGSAKDWLKSFVITPPPAGDSQRNDAIAQLKENVGVWAPELSTVITVTCKARSPKLAQEIVDTLVKVCIDEHARSNRTAGSHEFFREQSEILRSQWTDRRQQLNSLKDEQGIATIEAQFTLLEQKKSEIELSRLRNITELSAAQAKYKAIQSALENLEPTVLLDRVDGVESKAADGMRQQLYELEIRERELLAKYHTDHPLVVAIQRQIEESRRIHEAQESSRTTSRFGYDPAWQLLHTEESQVEVQVATLAATEVSLEKQLAEVTSHLRELNSYASQHDVLQSDVDRLATSYAAYSESLEQSRINHALETQRITNVNVVQSATYLSKPIGPSKTMIAGLGLLISLAGAVGLTLLRDHLDQSPPAGQLGQHARQNSHTNPRGNDQPIVSHSDVSQAPGLAPS